MSPAGRGRALGLDLGDRRIGVAVCDSGRTVATPLETVGRVGDRPVEHARIAELAVKHEVTTVVVGMPYSLDGDEGPAAKRIASEVKALRRRLGDEGIEVVTHDERFTTVTAEASLRRAGVGGRKQRGVVDQVAAAVILQSWLDGLATS